MRDILLTLITRMQQPSIPELLEYSKKASYLHHEFRKVSVRSYSSIYYYLNSLVQERKIMRLTADGGYMRRYCIYNNGRRYDHRVEPIPAIHFQKDNIVKFSIHSNEFLLDTNDEQMKKHSWNGRELQILKLHRRYLVILDRVLLAALCHDKTWHVRLPWRFSQKGTEHGVAFTKLRSMGEKIDVLGVKGRRTICPGEK